MELVLFKDLLEDDAEPQYGLLEDRDEPSVICLCCGSAVEFGDYEIIERLAWQDLSSAVKQGTKNKYVVCMNEEYVRDSEMLDTSELSDEEFNDIDFTSCEIDDLWHDMEAEPVYSNRRGRVGTRSLSKGGRTKALRQTLFIRYTNLISQEKNYMHYLHKILVHIPDIDDEWEAKDDIKELIRSKAEYETENYANQTFDWRETENAGRWKKEYPEQVYIAADNLEWFINELQGILAAQKHEIDYCLMNITKQCGGDLNELVNGLWNINDEYDKTRPGYNDFTAYYLSKIGKMLHGEYISDSMFFNASAYTARLYQSDIEQVKVAPQDWALVMFDYHN